MIFHKEQLRGNSFVGISKVKCACVIQGDIRRGTEKVLAEMSRHFDEVILSTWEDEQVIPKGDFHIILNKKPLNPGISHRNYQRLSSAVGIRYAEQLGCTHVLKWRTDMLPTNLKLDTLLEWSKYKLADGIDSRIVTCAFRNITVDVDSFSSMPDLFAFGSIKMMKMLWDDTEFDFTKEVNFPVDMVNEYSMNLLDDYEKFYYAESEVYAYFKYRLQRHLNKKLTQREIAKSYLYLFNHERLKICWFDKDKGFRSIFQAGQHPWWSERIWRSGEPDITNVFYSKNFWWKPFKEYITPWIVKKNIKRQSVWYKNFLRAREMSKIGESD